MSEIIPNLYIAGLEDVMKESETGQLGITHVLNVASEINVYRSREFHYKHVSVSDDGVDDRGTDDIASVFDECSDWIHEGLRADGRVMISCWSGVSRSVCVAMAYLASYCDMSADDAYIHVLKARPQADPFGPYMDQFRTYFKA